MNDHIKILNPNSSGQGYCNAHWGLLQHTVLCKYGWGYSHTTPITSLTGNKYGLHTYKLGDWNIGLSVNYGGDVFGITCSRGGSGRQTMIPTYDLSRYLKVKTYSVLREMKKGIKCNSASTKATPSASPEKS